jgi:hypothetical protein
VSVQREYSDSTDSADREERRLPFSLADSSALTDCAEDRCVRYCRDRKGMLEEVRGEDVGVMLTVITG